MLPDHAKTTPLHIDFTVAAQLFFVRVLDLHQRLCVPFKSCPCGGVARQLQCRARKRNYLEEVLDCMSHCGQNTLSQQLRIKDFGDDHIHLAGNICFCSWHFPYKGRPLKLPVSHQPCWQKQAQCSSSSPQKSYYHSVIC